MNIQPNLFHEKIIARNVAEYWPWLIYLEFKKRHTKWLIVHNEYKLLMKTVRETLFKIYPHIDYNYRTSTVNLTWPVKPKQELYSFDVTLILQPCGTPQEYNCLMGMEVTGVWIIGAVEKTVKDRLFRRAGRYPKGSPAFCCQTGHSGCNESSANINVYT